MRTLLFTLISLGCMAALAGPVYKWVDENGVVHYSDQPHPNSQKVQVAPVQTYKSTHGNEAPTPPAPESAPEEPAYSGCSIAQPQDNQDFPNLEQLRIVVFTNPGLRSGDRVVRAGQFHGCRPSGQPVVIVHDDPSGFAMIGAGI